MDAIEDMLFNPERNERQHEYQLREEGREEGIEIGREEAKLEVARNLLAKKMSVDFVAEITGLDIETVCKIQSEYSIKKS